MVVTYDLIKQAKQEYSSVNERLVYRGIGVLVNDEALKQGWEGFLRYAGLDYQIRYLNVKFGDYIAEDQHVIFREVYDEELKKLKPVIYGYASNDWIPFQNKEILEEFFSFCQNAGLYPERIGSLQKGKIVFCTAKLNIKVLVGQDDVVDAKLILSNGHCPGRGLHCDILALREVCANGQTLGVKFNKQILTHRSQLKDHNVEGICDRAVQQFYEFGKQLKKMSEFTMPPGTPEAIIVAIAGDSKKPFSEQPQAVKEILKLYNGKAIGSEKLESFNTGWGLQNAVTQYYNHSAASVSPETHLNSLWFAEKRRTQQKAMGMIQAVMKG